jgi:hypothetical protein
VSYVGRSAVLATALFFVTQTIATADPPQHALPAGSTVVFVSDGRLDVGAKAGSTAKVHLRDDLHLDGYLIAAAGTPARITLGGPTIVAGRRVALVSLDDFVTKPGRLPVRPRSATIEALDVGTTIEATTLAAVQDVDGRLSIRVPFPFRLSTDTPFSMYTPTPAKTASPLLPERRGRRPSGRPEPQGTASPAAVPSTIPSPSPTKIPP